MSFLEKIQSLSEKNKKIIFWTLLVIIACVLSFFWVKSSKTRIEKLKTSSSFWSSIKKNINSSELPNPNENLER